MVNRSSRPDRLFAALGSPARLAIVEHLARRPGCPVSELAAPLAISLPAVSRHLKVLEGSGLVRRRVEGRVHHLRLDKARLAAAEAWLEHCRAEWDARLDNLARALDGLDEPEPSDA